MEMFMARFNQPVLETQKTTNLAGGTAFTETPELELISLMLTSFVKSQYYRSEDDSISRLKELIGKVNPMFAAKAAIYARNEFGMRTITHLAVAEVVKNVKHASWTRRFVNKAVYRVDDMTEIMAYWLSNYGKPIPHALRNGLADALTKFNDYQFAKYRASKKDVKLVDVVNLCHPYPNATITKLVKGELRSKDTWETKLTQAGQKAETKEEKQELKKEAWKDLVLNKKIGYFALLRNLRNILEQAPEVLDTACEILADPQRVRKSLVFPFRFATALEEIAKLVSTHDITKVVNAINDALNVSVENVPKLPGSTLVALDESGSMRGNPIEIGSLFTAILVKSCNADVITFASSARARALNQRDTIGTIMNILMRDYIGAGTNFNSIFTEVKKAYDRIIILSDMQGWMNDSGYVYRVGGAPTETFKRYRKQFNCDPHVYSWDLQGYGTLQFPERNVYALAGFSDKCFDIMKLLEQDKQALIKLINEIEL
jgi:hypothetical protein